MRTANLIDLIKQRAAMRRAAQTGSLVIFPSSMETSADFHRLGIAHLHNPKFTTSHLLATPVMYPERTV
ncbi:hypothetical protein [Pseudogulbenkiania ferrooxidans]|uniref:Uncharacterized protein n=1 Tax=Pseudogulbenkiania ferrooxidans 2002 TaxID=279714 RepID=B9YYS2_9NEIS|nr:hypothetical protein [Pseudogulbenkiania ferrooxidans]EEG10275.1 hypothetical protein FuraDRAFT_0257 [Pseudogulbenkiania ferrooxidans 2002]